MRTRFLSQTFGSPVVTSQDHHRVGRVHDILVDHETGKIAAFLLSHHHIIQPQDVLLWKDYLLIPDEMHLASIDEVVRVQEVFRRHIPLFGKRVITEQGEYIGHVYDLEFQPDVFTLKNLYTAKIFFIFKFQQRIIPMKYIVEVKKKAIVIKDPREKKRMKEAIREKSLSPAI